MTIMAGDQKWSERIARGLEIEEELRPEYEQRRSAASRAYLANVPFEERQRRARRRQESMMAPVRPDPDRWPRSSNGKVPARQAVAARQLGIKQGAYNAGKSVIRAVFSDPDHYGELLEVLDLHGPHVAVKRMRELERTPRARTNPNHQVAQIVAQLEGLASAARQMEVTVLDVRHRYEWSNSLRDSIRALQHFERQVRGRKR